MSDLKKRTGSVGDSVDKSPESLEALGKRLAGERISTIPTVRAYEVAQELGIHPTALSNFERGLRALPDRMGEASYRTALERVARRKQGDAA